MVFFIDDGRSLLKAIPDNLAVFHGHGTYFAPLLMKLLQLMESRNHIGFLFQAFRRLAQLALQLIILLEVILPELVVDAYQVIKLFHIILIAFPKLVYLGMRQQLNLIPLLLKIFEFLIYFIEILAGLIFGERLYFFYDELFFLNIVFFFGLLFGKQTGPFFFYFRDELFSFAVNRSLIGDEIDFVASVSQKSRFLPFGFQTQALEELRFILIHFASFGRIGSQ